MLHPYKCLTLISVVYGNVIIWCENKYEAIWYDAGFKLNAGNVTAQVCARLTALSNRRGFESAVQHIIKLTVTVVFNWPVSAFVRQNWILSIDSKQNQKSQTSNMFKQKNHEYMTIRYDRSVNNLSRCNYANTVYAEGHTDISTRYKISDILNIITRICIVMIEKFNSQKWFWKYLNKKYTVHTRLWLNIKRWNNVRNAYHYQIVRMQLPLLQLESICGSISIKTPYYIVS